MKTIVQKLYGKLTPKEQANLAFEALVRKDENETELIVHSVEWQTYRSVHTDYRQRVERLIFLASCYSMEHWKTRALMFQSFYLYVSEGEDNAWELGNTFFSRLESIEVALVDVCKQAHIAIESVKSFAGIDDFQPQPESADPDMVTEYFVTFSDILKLGE